MPPVDSDHTHNLGTPGPLTLFDGEREAVVEAAGGRGWSVQGGLMMTSSQQVPLQLSLGEEGGRRSIAPLD